MLRSLYAGVSGLRAHQTALDNTANNIANVNTAGYKATSVQFQDTLSQVLKSASGPAAERGGTNPAQIGLGVQIAAISTNFTQGASQATGRGTDMQITGDGFFAVQSGGETLYTRAGAFDFDSAGNLVTASGAYVQGWTANNGAINTGGATGNITLPVGATSAAKQTTEASLKGNLPNDAAIGTELVRDVPVYDTQGNKTVLPLTFTKTGAGWDVGNGTGTTGSLTFNDGVLTTTDPLTIDGVSVDLSAVTGFAGVNTLSLTAQNGAAAGTLESYSFGPDGTLYGSFSNGTTEPIARISLANFANPGGLEKAGGSTYRATANSGIPALGGAGDAGFGGIATGTLEMSNVDLSEEFTDLIIAQRGFQANARIITTSDEVLQELTNLKR